MPARALQREKANRRLHRPEYSPAARDSADQGGRVREEEIEPPSTFQLAQLAATLATRPESVSIPPADVVLEAMQLWEAAAKFNLASRQQKELWERLYVDSREEWERRIQTFAGDKIVLQETLSEQTLRPDDDVLPHLFPGSGETAASRREKVMELLNYAQQHGILCCEPVRPRLSNRSLQHEQVLGENWNAFFVRLLVETRREQQRTAPGLMSD